MNVIYKLLNGKNIIQEGGDNDKIPKHLEFIGTLWYIINDEKKYCCGCSYLGDGYVLTAAHCLINKKKDQIRIQFNSIRLDICNAEYCVDEVKIHPFFNNKKHRNDIAIVKLINKPDITPILLPFRRKLDSFYKIGNNVKVYGFGQIARESNVSIYLKEIGITIVSQNETKYPKKFIHPSMLFVSDKRNIPLYQKMDTFQGDSGNALIYSIDGKNYIIGIVSFGLKKLKPGYPGVYTKIGNFLHWIKKNSNIKISS
jgi:secreted trypsin-like serine protease